MTLLRLNPLPCRRERSRLRFVSKALLGFPSAPLKVGRVQRQGGLGVDADVDRLTAVVVADLDVGGGGDAGFQFNPPADLAGEVTWALLQFHEVQWVRMSLTL